MRFQTLDDWLAWQETLHPSRVDLRLERVGRVWERLHPGPLPFRLPFPVITVGGTNGKGSCIAYLEAWYRAAGYRCCAYTSPHLLRYNERVRIDGAEASDRALCAAFARIDAAREEATLTYFEFGTLAALDLFVRAGPDVALLEVGLGGRLDAVNVFEPEVSLVTGIGRDHCTWLGDEPDAIAFEKAGIFRAGCPAVIGQRQAPARLRARAEEIGAVPLQLGREFDYRPGVGQWRWRGPGGARRDALPPPALRGAFQYDNAAAALCALEQLAPRLPVESAALRRGLHGVQVPGRFTVLPGRPSWILDVAHNDQAAAALAQNLRNLPCTGRRHAVLSLLADKDAEAVMAPLLPLIASWHTAPAPSARAMPVTELLEVLDRLAASRLRCGYEDVEAAMAGALAEAAEGDLILVFGSFTSIEAALRSPLLPSV